MLAKANAPVVPIINKSDFSNYVIPVSPRLRKYKIQHNKQIHIGKTYGSAQVPSSCLA